MAILNNAPLYASCWVEISKGALRNNVAYYKQLVGKGKLLVLVKGNAYGHGMVTVGQLLDAEQDVYCLGVFFLSEAVALRNAGVTKKILVLGAWDLPLENYSLNDVELVVFTADQLAQLASAAQSTGTWYAIHIKIDTGLGRFGIAPADAVTFFKKAQEYDGVRCVGLMTHCAESQASDQRYTIMQRDSFFACYQACAALVTYPLYMHFANSAGTLRYPIDAPQVIHRVGVGAYGYWPSLACGATVSAHGDVLEPVLAFKTRIHTIKNASKGAYLGYNRTFCSNRDMRYAILPVGYYDGYSPELSNKGVVKIGQWYAPVIGRVAMNTIMVDITDIPETINQGDQVLLIGNDPALSAVAVASHTSFNNMRYVLTLIAAHVPRVVVP